MQDEGEGTGVDAGREKKGGDAGRKERELG
jgi:hypothetical protein